MATSEYPVCPICVESFTIPKVLGCGHSYCLECLRTYVGNKKGKFKCAVCSELVEIPAKGIEAFITVYALIRKRESIAKTESKCINHALKDAECYCRKCEVGLCYKCLHTKHNDHDYFDSESETERVIVLEEVSQYKQNIRHSINEMRNVSDYLIMHTSGQKLSQRVGNVEEEMKTILSTSSNASLLTLVQRLSKLKQLHAEMKEEVKGFEWIRNTVDIPESFGTVQRNSTKEECDSSQEGCFGGEQHIQFSFRFHFEPNVFEGAKTRVLKNSGEEIYMYLSQDKYCTSALRKLTWSCYLKQFDNEAIGVYVVLLADENDQIKHCVIDYKLSLHHPDNVDFPIKEVPNKTIPVNVSNGGCYERVTKIINLLRNTGRNFQIQFDIIKIREIVTK